MENEFKSDPENYYKMSVPFESPELANEAIRNFYKEVEMSRKKYNIADVLFVIKGNVKYKDNEIGQFLQHCQYGNQLNAVQMAAYVYGKTSEEEREIINKFLAGKING